MVFAHSDFYYKVSQQVRDLAKNLLKITNKFVIVCLHFG